MLLSALWSFIHAVSNLARILAAPRVLGACFVAYYSCLLHPCSILLGSSRQRDSFSALPVCACGCACGCLCVDVDVDVDVYADLDVDPDVDVDVDVCV